MEINVRMLKNKTVKVNMLPDGSKQFYIDVGNLPVHKAFEFIKKVKASLDE